MSVRIALCCAALFAPAALSAQSASNPPALLNLPAQPGSWTHVPTATGGQARFVDSTGQVRLTLACTRATRRIAIALRSGPVSGMSVTTSSAARFLPATHNPQAGMASAELPASDSLFDAIAFSRGRFAISVQGLAALVVPAWPETARAIEDCRN